MYDSQNTGHVCVCIDRGLCLRDEVQQWTSTHTHKKRQHKPSLYFCFRSSVGEELSYKPVKADLDGVSWLSLNDPLTTERVFVVAWPPRGKDDTRQPWVVASAGGWTHNKVEERVKTKQKSSEIFLDITKTLLLTRNMVCFVKEKCSCQSARRGHFGYLPQYLS